MTAVPMTVFQASDLQQRGRVVLDTARDGEARVRDKDGLSLLIVPESRAQAWRFSARVAANLAMLQHALARSDEHPDLPDFGDWTWLRSFDEEDLREFLRDMWDVLIVAVREDSSGLIEETLALWRTTAETLEDPLRREILLGRLHERDYVEAARPGAVETAVV